MDSIGYLVIGDAISSFSPAYGQGMSCAALQAMELRNVLAEGTDNLARRFFAKAAKVIDTPWTIVVGNDLRMPEAKGPRSAKLAVINWYISKLHRAATVIQLRRRLFFGSRTFSRRRQASYTRTSCCGS